jgi:hypothetical protein
VPSTSASEFGAIDIDIDIVEGRVGEGTEFSSAGNSDLWPDQAGLLRSPLVLGEFMASDMAA